MPQFSRYLKRGADRPDCIDQAARLGAHTVLIGRKAAGAYRPDLHLTSLSELPDQVHRLPIRSM